MKALKTIIILLFIMAVSTGACLADYTYYVEGHVYEKATGKPLSGAHLRYYFAGDTEIMANSDKNGFYQFKLEVGNYPTPIPQNFGLRIVATLVFGQPDPMYHSEVFIQYPPLEGHVYQRNIYIDIPREWSDDIHYDILDAISDVNSNVGYTQDKVITYGDEIKTLITTVRSYVYTVYWYVRYIYYKLVYGW